MKTNVKTKESEYDKLQAIGASCAECLADMVAALECDYDRLQELEDLGDDIAPEDTDEYDELKKAAGDCESRDDAADRISEDPLEISYSGHWSSGETPRADKAYILLGTGGPATRIVCELDEDMQPHRAWIEAQDWFQPWTQYMGDAISSEDLLTYCQQFCFGEGE